MSDTVYFPNATITISRPGVRGAGETSIATGRRVQIDLPTRQERIAAGGAAVPAQLWDTADAITLYQSNDVVIITAFDGYTTVPRPTAYRVGLVEATGEPLPATSVELHGEGGYQ